MLTGLVVALSFVIYLIIIPWIVGWAILNKQYGKEIDFISSYYFLDKNLTKSEKIKIEVIRAILTVPIFLIYLKLSKIDALLGFYELIFGVIIIGTINFVLLRHYLKNKEIHIIPIIEKSKN
ncbi:hypothetical protein JH146_0533 [Methanocaldococcus bathoardescens]|uniref:DUF3784 domain-containing protein n=1 Tax=Methanocaldococcus bathoardescens TaxID=1301915 RepID=A0A076LFX9_9EURY|nr:hypothetical protein [Methanocaldococcus bathoardescens]AIJ05383.1 hypothetical protein JH146_0533 [Methanocaldococcus bathoardescens]